jgi:hypothetical protein
MAEVELSGTHRRVLTIRLRAVEEAIAAIRQTFNGRPEDGMLLTYAEPVTESAYPQLQALAAQLEERLKRVVEALELQPSQRSLRRELLGQLNICWVDVEDARPEALTGYGELSPEAAAYLDVEIRQLCRLLMQAIGVLTRDAEQSQN